MPTSARKHSWNDSHRPQGPLSGPGTQVLRVPEACRTAGQPPALGQLMAWKDSDPLPTPQAPPGRRGITPAHTGTAVYPLPSSWPQGECPSVWSDIHGALFPWQEGQCIERGCSWRARFSMRAWVGKTGQSWSAQTQEETGTRTFLGIGLGLAAGQLRFTRKALYWGQCGPDRPSV